MEEDDEVYTADDGYSSSEYDCCSFDSEEDQEIAVEMDEPHEQKQKRVPSER